jgi:alkylhydroperoxidase/carboxymuconolactone decarboxylase family protein YurZ
VDEHVPTGEQVIQRIQERRGHVWPLHQLMAELDPGFLDVFDEAYCYTLGVAPAPPSSSLEVRYRELVCACACAMMPVPIEVTAHHLERAYDNGLTEREALEGFQALLIPGGGIAVSNGVRAMMYVRERRQADAPGAADGRGATDTA